MADGLGDANSGEMLGSSVAGSDPEMVEGIVRLPSAGEPKRMPRPDPAHLFLDKISALGLVDPTVLEKLALAGRRLDDLAGELVRRHLVLPQTMAALGLEAYEHQGFGTDIVLIDPNLLQGFDLSEASRRRFLPLAQTGNIFHVAVADYLDVARIQEVRTHLPVGAKLAPELWPQAELRAAFDMAFDGRFALEIALADVIDGDAIGMGGGVSGGLGTERPRRTPPMRPAFEPKSRRIARSIISESPRCAWNEGGLRVFNALANQMVARGAGTLRFEADQGAVSLRWRMNGIMVGGQMINERQARAMFEALEVMGAVGTKAQVRLGLKTYALEVHRNPAQRASGALELKPLRASAYGLAQLKFSDNNLKLLRRLLGRPRGLVLVAAPAGHGKTRTLGAIARATVPLRKLGGIVAAMPEIEMPELAFCVARSDEAMAEAICGLMKQSADVILIDEPLGPAAWAAALDATLSGALVVASVRASDASTALARVMGQGLAAHDVALALQGIVAQSLVPALCPTCKKTRGAGAGERRVLSGAADHAVLIAESEGCSACGQTGARGRLPLAEVFLSDAVFSVAVAERKPRATLLEAARERGTQSLGADGIARVRGHEVGLVELIQAIDLSGEGLGS